jgi:cytochrome c-type biogenesis protein CcmE
MLAKSFKGKKVLFVAVIIGLCMVGLSFLNMGEYLVYFYTPSEAIAKAADLEGQTIRVGAMVKAGTVVRVDGNLTVNFVATDLKGSEFNVVHRGPIPDMFKEGQGVVVEGRMTEQGKKFIAQNLLVKHSEEYKKPDDHTKMDAEYLQKSLFKNEAN